MAQPPPVAFLDDPHAPEIFASGITGYFILNGNVVITFESARADHSVSPGPVNRVVCARIILPIGAAQDLALNLHDLLARQGLNPTAAAKGSATSQ